MAFRFPFAFVVVCGSVSTLGDDVFFNGTSNNATGTGRLADDVQNVVDEKSQKMSVLEEHTEVTDIFSAADTDYDLLNGTSSNTTSSGVLEHDVKYFVDELDEDNDGKLSLGELQAVMEGNGLEEPQNMSLLEEHAAVNDIFSAADTDHDGLMSVSEIMQSERFLSLLIDELDDEDSQDHSKELTAEDVGDFVGAVDDDKDGKVNFLELQKLMENDEQAQGDNAAAALLEQQSEVKSLFDTADTDKDGGLSIEEIMSSNEFKLLLASELSDGDEDSKDTDEDDWDTEKANEEVKPGADTDDAHVRA